MLLTQRLLADCLHFRCVENPKLTYVLITELPDYSGTLEELFRLILGSKVLAKQFFDTKQEKLFNLYLVEKNSGEVFRVLATSALQSMGKFNKTLDCDAAIEILKSVSADAGSENDIPLV